MATMREIIEQRAYELFMKRGGVHGYHMEDWLQAEKEITGGAAGNKNNTAKQPANLKKEAVAGPAAKPSRPISSAPRKGK
jgi:hypothetical protein